MYHQSDIPLSSVPIPFAMQGQVNLEHFVPAVLGLISCFGFFHTLLQLGQRGATMTEIIMGQILIVFLDIYEPLNDPNHLGHYC